MRYGHFDDERREYVITRPDTPLPWINYLGSEDYFGIISNTAGGYSFYRDARLRRLTRYRYNNAPLDLGGRYVYLRDDASGDYWSPSWQPTQRDLEDYSCRHGLGYSIISSRYRGIRAETLYFVPGGETLEVWRLAADQRAGRAGAALALQLGRVLPLGRPGRRHQLPAQLLRRRGRGRGRRHLPQDRVPRAARSLRLLRLLRAAGRLRHAARRVPGALPRLGPADRRRAGRLVQLDRPRLAAVGLAPRPPRARPRARRRRSSSCSATPRTRADAKFDPPGSQTIDKRRVRPTIARYLDPAAVAEAFDALRARWTDLLGDLPGRRPGTSTSTAWSTSGTPTSAWSPSTCRARRRSSSRASAAGWGSATPTRTCSASSTWSRRAPASGSWTSPRRSCRRAAPTTSTSRSPSAATTTSARGSTTTRLAGPGRGGLPQGDRRRVDPRRGRALRQRARHRAPALRAPPALGLATPSTASARTACR